MPLNLDFNDRERKRNAEIFESIAEHATKCAASLRYNDDDEFIVNFLMVSIMGSSLKSIAKDMLRMDFSEDSKDFPEFVVAKPTI